MHESRFFVGKEENTLNVWEKEGAWKDVKGPQIDFPIADSRPTLQRKSKPSTRGDTNNWGARSETRGQSPTATQVFQQGRR